MKIGIAGTGRMGAAIAQRLMALGHELTVWNRTIEKAQALAAAGAKVAATPFQAASFSETVMTILTDAAALYPDKCGTIYFGTREGSPLPIGWAVTHKMVEKIGYFAVPYFPYWYHDTWLDEIARMTGRNFYADVNVTFPNGQGKTRGLRDVAFWATFFDLTRPLRKAIADKILRDPDLIQPNWHRMQLLQTIDAMCSQLEQRNANLRDPLQAKNWETQVGFDNDPTPAYLRIKDAAQAMLHELYPQTEAA